jgi:hypothetical protein
MDAGASLEADVAHHMASGIPVPVITEPDPNAAPVIPYEKQNRVPEALLDLEEQLVAATGADPQRFVIIEGVAAGGRKAAVFEVRRERAVERIEGYLIAYRDGAGKLHVVLKASRPAAMERWEEIVQSIEVIARAQAAAEVFEP